MKLNTVIIVFLFINCLSMQKDKDVLIHTNLKIDDISFCETKKSIMDCLIHMRKNESIIVIVNKIESNKHLNHIERSCNEFIFLKAFFGNFLKLNRCNFSKLINVSYSNIPDDEIIIFHSIENDFYINPILEFYNSVFASFWAIPAPWYYYHTFKGELAVIKISDFERYLNGGFQNE